MRKSTKQLLRGLLFFVPFHFSFANLSWQNSPECLLLNQHLGIDTASENIQDTDSFLVIKNNRLIYERHAPGFSSDTPHRMWSASKLIANLVVARAVYEGRLSLDQRLEEFFPAQLYQKDLKSFRAYQKITVRDLLGMRSGFLWEELETYNLEKLSVVKMIYGEQSQDVLSYVLSGTVKAEFVGKVFNYSTADYNILSGILRKVYGAEYDRLPWKLLFNVLKMIGVVVERDSVGTYLLGSNVYMSPIDFSKIGRLLLGKGVWKGQPLLPHDWVQNMRDVNFGLKNPNFTPERIQKLGVMGSPFWLNLEMPNVAKAWPDFPKDTYMAFGFLGQNLAIIPSQNLVFLRFGQDLRYGRKVNGLAKPMYACLRKGNFW